MSGHQEEVGHLSEEMHIRERERSLLTLSPERKRTQSQTGMSDLFAEVAPVVETEKLADGAFLFRRFAAADADSIVETITQIAKISPFRHMITPGGYRMSVAMTNCGPAGWTTDRQGYRYTKIDPETGVSWPPMPSTFQQLREGSGASGFRRLRT